MTGATEPFRGPLVRGEQWRTLDLTGQRVAVIASGAEAAAIVPTAVLAARSVKVFQTSPSWVLTTRVHVPLAGGLARRAAARLHLRVCVTDPWLRRQLTPLDADGPYTVAHSFYTALQRSNCKLITWPVYAVVADGVRTAEGVEHHVDCIIVGDSVELPGPVRPGKPARREERIA